MSEQIKEELKLNIDTIVNDNIQEIKRRIEIDMVKDISDSLKRTIGNKVYDIVDKWLLETLEKYIKPLLENKKHELVKNFPEILAKVDLDIKTAIEETITKNLKDDWKRKKIFEAMFQ